ncbi:predicted protein [Nematostella vectensis]|uniref:Uncharacterized protein n=1 Tax=Nematostella vectensis TaxID=45351 RepID=A7SUD1_NEMVE|nr:predicted protein [Nematostella vectensis]|eukprot:XP_001624783.1 predicted protein [Nematostella vectensis]
MAGFSEKHVSRTWSASPSRTRKTQRKSFKSLESIDRIVIGTSDESERERLLRERPVPDLARAVESLRAAEISRAHKQVISGKPEPEPIHHTDKERNNPAKKRGAPRGQATKAMANREFLALKTGHFATVCQSAKQVHEVDDDEDSHFDTFYTMGEVNSISENFWSVELLVNGNASDFKLDSGSKVTVVSDQTPWIKGMQLEEVKTEFRGPGGVKLSHLMKGQIPNATFQAGDKAQHENVYVMGNQRNNLLSKCGTRRPNFQHPLNATHRIDKEMMKAKEEAYREAYTRSNNSRHGVVSLPALEEGDKVHVREGRFGEVQEKLSNPRSCQVLTDAGSSVRRNRRHLIHLGEKTDEATKSLANDPLPAANGGDAAPSEKHQVLAACPVDTSPIQTLHQFKSIYMEFIIHEQITYTTTDDLFNRYTTTNDLFNRYTTTNDSNDTLQPATCLTDTPQHNDFINRYTTTSDLFIRYTTTNDLFNRYTTTNVFNRYTAINHLFIRYTTTNDLFNRYASIELFNRYTTTNNFFNRYTTTNDLFNRYASTDLFNRYTTTDNL